MSPHPSYRKLILLIRVARQLQIILEDQRMQPTDHDDLKRELSTLVDRLESCYAELTPLAVTTLASVDAGERTAKRQKAAEFLERMADESAGVVQEFVDNSCVHRIRSARIAPDSAEPTKQCEGQYTSKLDGDQVKSGFGGLAALRGLLSRRLRSKCRVTRVYNDATLDPIEAKKLRSFFVARSQLVSEQLSELMVEKTRERDPTCVAHYTEAASSTEQNHREHWLSGVHHGAQDVQEEETQRLSELMPECHAVILAGGVGLRQFQRIVVRRKLRCRALRRASRDKAWDARWRRRA